MLHKIKDVIELTKPGISALVLLTTAVGLLLAPVKMTFLTSLSLLLGTWLLVGAANTFNCILEKDVDAKMPRTMNRPLPTGRMTLLEATLIGSILLLVAVVILLFTTPRIVPLLGGISFLIYVFLYTPLKRWSMSSLFVGAIPGAIPPVMGWTGNTGIISYPAWSLFAIMFLWQLPHFMAISLNRASEYRQTNLKVYSLICGERVTKISIAITTALTVLASFLPFFFGLVGVDYLLLALLLGTLLLMASIRGLKEKSDPAWAKNFFRLTIIYLPLLFLGLVVSHYLKNS